MPFSRIWLNNPFLSGSLQSLTTLAETLKRRNFMAPYFSKAAISRAQPTLHGAKLRTFLRTLAAADGQVVNFWLGFRCLTADVVIDYCFQSDLDALSSPGFRNHTLETFVEGFELGLVATFFLRFFAALEWVIFRLPDSMRAKYFAPIYGFEMMQRLARAKVEEALSKADKQEDGAREYDGCDG
jgi:hypothetical protein